MEHCANIGQYSQIKHESIKLLHNAISKTLIGNM